MSSRRPGSHTVSGTILLVLSLLTAIAVIGVPVYALPPQSTPARADVVFVLGPVDPWRMHLADQLIGDGVSENLLVSAPLDGIPNIPECADPPGRKALCAQPEPFTTRGEARFLKREMEANGWTTAVVITSTPHIVRTRMLMGRCVPTGVSVIGKAPDQTPMDWAYQYVYQTLALAKAVLFQGC